MLREHRCEPIWYALAALPALTGPQWRTAVEHAHRSGMGDRQLLRVLSDRPDRSGDDRRWLLTTADAHLLDRVLASAQATAEQARLVLARAGRERDASTWRRGNLEVQAIAEGLCRHPRLGQDLPLLEVAVDAVTQLDPDEALDVAGDWPDGHEVPEALLWPLLTRAVHVGPDGARRSWHRSDDTPVPQAWAGLWQLLRHTPPAVQAEAARRFPRVQAVLLTYAHPLDPAVLAACVPVLADPYLGGPDPLSTAGRMVTLRAWTDRHPALAGSAAAAKTAASQDVVRGLAQPGMWKFVDDLVAFTTDPQILADAVHAIVGYLRLRLQMHGHGDLLPPQQEWANILHAARTALVTLARSPHTPADALIAVLPVTPEHTPQDFADARPELADACTAEQLARTRVFELPQLEERVPEIPDDQQLAAGGDPAAALAAYLMELPTAGRAYASRLAVRLLRSRHADATVLAALPADIAIASPWHADLAAGMLAEACGDDPARWTILPLAHTHDLTFAGLLAELRDYTPTATGEALAGYRLCHACQLATAHEWLTFHGDQVAARRQAERHPGWMACLLCGHGAPPAPLLRLNATIICEHDRCGRRIDFPTSAALLQCECGQRYAAPDLPADLRPRLDAALAEQDRRAALVDALAGRIDDALAQRPDATGTPPPARLGDPDDEQRPWRPPLPVPEPGWLTDKPIGAQFRAALAAGLRHAPNQNRASTAMLRYGLGRARWPRTAAELAAQLDVAATTVGQRVNEAVSDLLRAAAAPKRSTPVAMRRAAVIAVYLADQAVGSLDVDDTEACATRIATLVGTALPGLDAGAGIRLLLRLTGRSGQLNTPRLQFLIELVGDELNKMREA